MIYSMLILNTSRENTEKFILTDLFRTVLYILLFDFTFMYSFNRQPFIIYYMLIDFVGGKLGWINKMVLSVFKLLVKVSTKGDTHMQTFHNMILSAL